MFDKSKAVKYFKEITNFKSYNWKYFKEIKRLKSLQVKAETYLEPKRASTIELFYGASYYFCHKSSIVDVWLGYI